MAATGNNDRDPRAMATRLNHALGRPLRVLHVGNIANNAYHNARLLNQIGIESSVIAYDYYHIMGCPEWEDADFDGGFGDQFRPDWSQVNLQNFQRPRWFAQGPRSICIAYLIARCRGWDRRAQTLWRWLEYAGRLRPGSRFKMSSLARQLRAQIPPWWLKPSDPDLNQPNDGRVQPALAPRSITARLRPVAAPLKRVLLRLRPVAARLKRVLLPYELPPQPKISGGFNHDVLAEFCREFPQRPPLNDADLAAYNAVISEWRELFQEYDVVLAYSTDPILPYLAGVPYLALEHGTLREIPYQDSVTGRLTALAYRRAAHVFVTNSDCLDSARWLAGNRVSLINHPYDDRHAAAIGGVQKWRDTLRTRLDANFLVFFPTRHDWVAGTGYADKANDVFLRAFGRLRAAGHRVGMVCCAWGSNIEESRDLLASLDCSAHVEWVEPMGTVKFERTAMACDIVADQFKLGAFGGVTFKALAAGVPVLTHLDPTLFNAQFPMPPVLNCQSTEAIHEGLLSLLRDPAALQALGRHSREWVDRHHNADTLLALEIEQFAQLVGVDLNQAVAPPTLGQKLTSSGS